MKGRMHILQPSVGQIHGSACFIFPSGSRALDLPAILSEA